MLACALPAMCGIVGLHSCNPGTATHTPEPPTKPAAPTGLATQDLTDVSVTLTWNGEADSYEVAVGVHPAVQVRGKSHALTGLVPAMNYIWRVRAKKGELYSDWTDGPGFKTDEPPVLPVAAPTNLAFSYVTDISAVLTWEGNASAYEVKVDGKTLLANYNTFDATGLKAETLYEWEVRAVDGDRTSKWVVGPSFKTGLAMTHRFEMGYCLEYGADSRGINNYYISLFDQYMVDSMNGFAIRLDLYAAGDPAVITDGTYTVGGNGEFGIEPQYSSLQLYVEGSRDRQHKITEGTIAVTKIGESTYKLVMDLLTEDGVEIKSVYSGEIKFQKPE